MPGPLSPPPPRPAPFVVGVPRSGTTLLRLMLDSHPQLTIPAETHFLPRLWRRLEAGDAPRLLRRRPAGVDLRRRRAAAGRRQALELITGHHRWPDWRLDAEALAARYAATEPFGKREAALGFFELCAQTARKPRWGDKSPSYRRHLRRIAAVLPEARFVHVIRDARDVSLSLMDVSWGPRTIAEARDLWVRDVTAARRQGRHVEHYLEVRYEDLVAAPEQCLRRVADFVALSWDERMLAYHERAAARVGEFAREFHMQRGVTLTAEERARQHRLTSEPPTDKRSGRWRGEMSATDRELFAGEAGELLAELGYGEEG